MRQNTILLVIIAALGGFIAGFMLANSLNRSQSTSTGGGPSVTTTNAPPANTSNTDDQELTTSEIKAKIAEADKSPENFNYQKDLGKALYQYASMKQDISLLGDAARILERANNLQPKDPDVLVTLGNARFDIAYANKDTEGFVGARELYTKALELKPGDADISTDRALTYFFQDPPDYGKAVTELQKVSEANPKHERSLQFLVQAFVKQNKPADADKVLARLRGLNPKNKALVDLESQVADARSASK
jgi:tetratricopeptide (TPR) repeat protein